MPLCDLAALIVNLTVVTIIVSALIKRRTTVIFVISEIEERRILLTDDIEESRGQRQQCQDESWKESDEPPPYPGAAMTST